MAKGYSAWDRERWFPETHSTRRSDFARDRARLLHSSALRRLAQKTQVVSPVDGLDFSRTRLTHSLEVAQVGREIAGALRLSANVVDTACLAHDIGHPPFGHNGERALNSWAKDIGGFEGNAQTLRVLTRLEPKVVSDRPYGMNLTRASLDASCKYPWTRAQAPTTAAVRSTAGASTPAAGDQVKFGVYDDDLEVFTWMREGAPAGQKCIEAEVMDLADDIAYSVHDFEDAIVGGFIDVRLLSDRVDHDALVGHMLEHVGSAFSRDDLLAAFDRLDSLEVWIDSWDGGRADHARLKNLASMLIGRFAVRSAEATRAHHPLPLVRYRGHVVVPDEVRAEIAVLKGIAAAFIMQSATRQPMYREQRKLLKRLADALWRLGPGALEPQFVEDWHEADSDDERRRVIVDQVASLTDATAFAWHERLLG